MREMCGHPGCLNPEIEFIEREWWRHLAGMQGHTAVVGTPARTRKRVKAQATVPAAPPEVEPQVVNGPLESLPRNARQLVELAIPPWTMRWSTSPTFVIVQGRLEGPLGRHWLHASWRNGKFEGCFVNETTRLSSKEMFQYVQREDLTK